MDKKEIGLKIKKLRTGKGFSQQELANMLSIDRTTLSKIETGENAPGAGILIELKRFFSISTDWLLTGSGPGPIDSNDNDVYELLTTIQENHIVKHAVLGFFYQLKANNSILFKKKENTQDETESREK